MSLTLLNPWMLLVGLVPLAALIVLYILKMKRQEFAVSAVFLWRKSIDDMRANAPFQRLRMNILFWLQLLIVLALTFALARPVGREVFSKRRLIVVMMDQSGSMAVKEDGRTRLERALEQANRLVDSLRTADEVCVVAFSNTASLVQSTTVDKFEAKRKLEDLKPRPVGTNFATALQIALAAVQNPSESEIHIFSDGAMRDLEEIDLAALVPEEKGLPSIRFHRIGERSANVGITTLSLRKVPETNDRYQLLVNVRNFGRESISGAIDLFSRGAEDPIDVTDLDLAPGDQDARVFELRITEPVQLYVKVTPLDGFPLDNYGYLATRRDVQERVLMVSDGNFYLERAMDVNSELLVEIVKPGTLPTDAGALEARLQGYGAIIWDQYSPKELPTGRHLFIAAPPKREGWGFSEQIFKSPQVIDWNATHEVMRFVSLTNLYVEEARKIDAPLGHRPLIDTSAGPVAVVYDGGIERFVVLGFALSRSNWPLFPSFPIFMSNSLRWLSGYSPGRIGMIVEAGEPIKLPIPIPPAIETLTLRRPGDRKTEIPVSPEKALIVPPQYETGFYTLEIGPQAELHFGVNLLDDLESDIAPRDTLELGAETTVKAGRPVGSARKYWPLLAAIALGVMMLEWFVYFGRIKLE